MPAVVAVAVLAGCGGGESVAPRTAIQSVVVPSAKSDASFEQRRAGWEQSVRSSIPSGFHVELGSTYVTKSGKLVYSEASVAMKTATAVGFAAGSKYFIYDRNQLDEIPRTSIKASPPERQTSLIHPICSPGGACGGGDPTPPPDPTPTDPPSFTVDATTSTASANSLAATRSTICTHQYNNNNYPNSYFIWSPQNTNTWTLHYTPGGPYYAGGSDNVTGNSSVVLIDGTMVNMMIPGGTVPENVDHTASVIYRDDLRKVSYVSITLYDYVPAYNLTNTVYSDDRITCSNDSAIGITAPHPPGPTDPPAGNGNGGGWTNKSLQPQPPR